MGKAVAAISLSGPAFRVTKKIIQPKRDDLPQRAQRKVKINQGNKLLFVT
jgi:DNA-binding IclR family transcriptional regulator